MKETHQIELDRSPVASSPKSPEMLNGKRRFRVPKMHMPTRDDIPAFLDCFPRRSIRRRKVAIIGAGPAGLAALKVLSPHMKCTLFEASETIAGTWAAKNPDSPLYQGFRTNLPKEIMGFLDFPFTSEFCSQEDLIDDNPIVNEVQVGVNNLQISGGSNGFGLKALGHGFFEVLSNVNPNQLFRSQQPASNLADTSVSKDGNSDISRSFVTAKSVENYLNAYAKHFNLNKNIKTQSAVVLAVRMGDSGQWVIRYKSSPWFKFPGGGSNNFKIMEAPDKVGLFDFLIVCNGHFNQRYFPEGILERYPRWKGLISHAKDFAGPAAVLVNLKLKSPQNIKTPQVHVHNPENDLDRSNHTSRNHSMDQPLGEDEIPEIEEPDEEYQEVLLDGKIVTVVGFKASGQDIVHQLYEDARVKEIHICDSGLSEEKKSAFASTPAGMGVPGKPRIFLHKKLVDLIIESYKVQAEGDDFFATDILIFATGYSYNFPFFSHKHSNKNLREKLLKNNKKRVAGLYRQIQHKHFPRLFFVGLPFGVIPFPLFDIQAQWILNRISLINHLSPKVINIKMTDYFPMKIISQPDIEASRDDEHSPAPVSPNLNVSLKSMKKHGSRTKSLFGSASQGLLRKPSTVNNPNAVALYDDEFSADYHKEKFQNSHAFSGAENTANGLQFRYWETLLNDISSEKEAEYFRQKRNYVEEIYNKVHYSRPTFPGEPDTYRNISYKSFEDLLDNEKTRVRVREPLSISEHLLYRSPKPSEADSLKDEDVILSD